MSGTVLKTFCSIRKDEDEDIYWSKPKYNCILFSTEDNDSVSLPQIYMIPVDIPLPPELENKFFRCTYEKGTITTGADIHGWLTKNTVLIIDTKTFITAVNRDIIPTQSNILPTFNIKSNLCISFYI